MNIKTIKNILLEFLIIIFFSANLYGQRENAFNEFKKISRPEKRWSIFHLFVANKAWKLTEQVIKTTDSIIANNILDNDTNGGQVDAFRHAYWMALLSRNIRWRKAYRLGKAHEKGDYIEYKRNKRKKNILTHDKISSEMDLWNNKIGIKIVKQNKKLKAKEIQKLVLENIKSGKMKIIKKNKKGEFLDEQNNIINNESLKTKWKNNKCLVPSNYKRK